MYAGTSWRLRAHTISKRRLTLRSWGSVDRPWLSLGQVLRTAKGPWHVSAVFEREPFELAIRGPERALIASLWLKFRTPKVNQPCRSRYLFAD